MNIIPDLEFRGLIYQATDLDGLAERLAAGPGHALQRLRPNRGQSDGGQPRAESCSCAASSSPGTKSSPWLAAALA